jgi:hypothetical protein
VTRFAARDAIKHEQRRQQRWQRVAEMRTEQAGNGIPLAVDADLDEAIACLAESDRQAIILRFYEDKSMAEIGVVLGINEAAAKKRVSRAIKRLRTMLQRKGTQFGSIALLAMLMRGARTAEAASNAALAKQVAMASIGRAEVSGHSARLASSTMRTFATAQCRVWAAMSGGALAVVAVIGLLSPVMGQVAAPFFHRVHATVARLTSDLPKIPQLPININSNTSKPKPLAITRMWLGTASDRGWPVLPLHAPNAPLPLRAVSGSNDAVAVAEDSQGQYWYRRLEPQTLPTIIGAARDSTIDLDLGLPGSSAPQPPLNFIDQSLAYFHSAIVQAAVESQPGTDWQQTNSPDSVGVMRLPFAGINGAGGDGSIMPPSAVPEPAGVTFAAAILLLSSRRRQRRV